MLPDLSIPLVSPLLNISIVYLETTYLILILILMGVAFFVIRSRDKTLRAKHKHLSMNHITVRRRELSPQSAVGDMQAVASNQQSHVSEQINQDVSKFIKKIPA